jgi:predicted nucleic acid-binding protein
MSVGVDTTWLVEVSVREYPGHAADRAKLERLAAGGEVFVLTPQVLNEFVYIVTDGKRFQNPLTIDAAIELAQQWWNAQSVRQIFPTADSVRLGWQWMRQYHLGRKHILHTQLAAAFHTHGIGRILTSNARDYRVFECFEVV